MEAIVLLVENQTPRLTRVATDRPLRLVVYERLWGTDDHVPETGPAPTAEEIAAFKAAVVADETLRSNADLWDLYAVLGDLPYPAGDHWLGEHSTNIGATIETAFVRLPSNEWAVLVEYQNEEEHWARIGGVVPVPARVMPRAKYGTYDIPQPCREPTDEETAFVEAHVCLFEYASTWRDVGPTTPGTLTVGDGVEGTTAVSRQGIQTLVALGCTVEITGTHVVVSMPDNRRPQDYLRAGEVFATLPEDGWAGPTTITMSLEDMVVMENTAN